MPFTGKILLVDDEPHVRKFIGLLARSLGSPVIIEAGTARTPWRSLPRSRRPGPPRCQPPGMDGVQILAAILAQNPSARVVMLTSLANRQTIEECLRLGALSYIRKDTPKEGHPRGIEGSRFRKLRSLLTAMPEPHPLSAPATGPSPQVGEVRYSLAEMLREIELERRESSFAMETLDQVEIQKMFASRRRRDVRRKK